MSAEGPYGGQERRASPRYKVSLHARWGGGEWAGREAAVGELSADGCFILTDQVVGVGELVRAELVLPGGEALPLWGHVIHVLERKGFGLRFSNFSQGGAREKLEGLLKRVAEGG
jgi:PilZ domain